MIRPDWILPGDKVNQPQAETIERTIRLAKHAHYVNVRIRVNGEWQELEADWIKHLRLPVPQPASPASTTDA